MVTHHRHCKIAVLTVKSRCELSNLELPAGEFFKMNINKIYHFMH